jgi:hypothetical protein
VTKNEQFPDAVAYGCCRCRCGCVRLVAALQQLLDWHLVRWMTDSLAPDTKIN